MQYLDQETLSGLMDWTGLVSTLRGAFTAELMAPVRSQLDIPTPHGNGITLLTMPAFQAGHRFGIKCATVAPDNATRGLPGVHAIYILFDGTTGLPLATFEADQLTAWRTAAASALASQLLSRPESSHLLVLGTGRMARALIEAHACVRPISTVSVWGRSSQAAADLAEEFSDHPFSVRTVSSLADAVKAADIISCATMSNEPLFDGNQVAPGTHVDLVGAFRPDMRESDDELMRRAWVFVDTYEGCLAEAGDLIASLASGALEEKDICGDLAALCRSEISGRDSPADITLFKSVGTAVEDLAAADWFFERHTQLKERT